MSNSLTTVLERLEALARYEGPWRTLRDETDLLNERLRELRQRSTRLDDLLVVALIGGSGAGKSTLLNALAGDELAPTSEFRPCTAVPMVYHPPGADLPFEGWPAVSGSALEYLVIADTPDSDTVVREHRRLVVQVLAQCDLILICGSPEKYLDEATWALLRPLQGERRIICVETKASDSAERTAAGRSSIREHWQARMAEEGFTIDGYFRVNALRALDRKLRGGEADRDEFEFPRLESFLREELSRDQVRRIKRSNVLGLFQKTLSRLEERVGQKAPELTALRESLDTAEAETLRAMHGLLCRRLLAEPHVWGYAMAREFSLRAKGIVGALFRVLEAVRSLPMRLGGWVPVLGRLGLGRQLAGALTGHQDEAELLAPMAGEIDRIYRGKRSEIALKLAQNGFEVAESDAELSGFKQSIEERVREALSGPVRDRLAAYARLLTSWPATLVADAPPLAFLALFGYRIVGAFLNSDYRSGAFFLHAGAVFGLLLALELVALSLAVRFAAWRVRRRAVRYFRDALAGRRIVFHKERGVCEEALALSDEIRRLISHLRQTD